MAKFVHFLLSTDNPAKLIEGKCEFDHVLSLALVMSKMWILLQDKIFRSKAETFAFGGLRIDVTGSYVKGLDYFWHFASVRFRFSKMKR
jgi:hypothetical protein